jgi:hypothetical protein
MAQHHATTADADIMLRLFELKRDPELKKARNFCVLEFWPRTVDDVLRAIPAFATPENNNLRQVIAFWEMAASFVLRGALHEDLFLDSAGEMFFLWAKFRPFIKEVRERLTAHELMVCVEKLIAANPASLERVAKLEKRIAEKVATMQAAADPGGSGRYQTVLSRPA